MLTETQRVNDQGTKSAGAGMPLRTGGIILATTTIAVVGLTGTASWIVGDRRLAEASRAFVDIAATVVADAAWFLPLLFGVVLAILAVLFGQGFTEIDGDRADVNRRRLAAATWVVAGLAVAVLVIAAAGAIGRAELAPHLWSIAVTTVLVSGAGLWVGTVVFGPAQQQLRVTRHAITDTATRLATVPRENRSLKPAGKMTVVALMVTAVSALLAFATLWVVPSKLPTGAWWPAASSLLGLAAAASAGGTVLAAFTAYFRDSATRHWQGLLTALVFVVLFVGIPILGSFRSVVWGGAEGPVVVMISVALAAPVLSVFLLPRGSLGGFTLRGSLDAARGRFIAGRLRKARRERDRLEALVRENELPPLPGPRGKFAHRSGKLFERPGLCDAFRRTLDRVKELRD